VKELLDLITYCVKTVKEDKIERLKQFEKAKKKMDEEDQAFFEDDLNRVDKIEQCSLFR